MPAREWTWVWPSFQPIIARWIDRLGLRTFPQYDDGDGILHGWGRTVQRYPIPGQVGIVRIVDGPGAMIDALARRLPVSMIRTGELVTGIEARNETAVAVTLASGEALSAEHVVLAVSLRVAAARIALPGVSPELHRSMVRTATWMSTQAKAVIVYDRPFWREHGLSGRIASRIGPLGEAQDHTAAEGSPGAIFGFVQWSPAHRRDDPDGLRRAIIAQLRRCLGAQAEQPFLLHIEDWASNALIATPADLEGPSLHPEPGPALLQAPALGGKLHLAVSETSHISPGLLEGALDAGERAARVIMHA